jgi:Leucine-rich repeat (LRR) protein
MCGALAVALAIVVCLPGQSRASDSDDVLAQCRKTSGGLPDWVTATLTRQQGHWRIAALANSSREGSALTDESLLPLSGLATLDSLELGVPSSYHLQDYTRLTPAAFRSLADLHLRHFVLAWNVNDDGLEGIAAMMDLEDLHLGGYYRAKATHDGALPCLHNLRNLRRLDLSWAGLSDASLQCIRPLEKLEELNLEGNAVTDEGVALLRGLTNLRSLTLDELGPEGVAVLEVLPHLEHLEIGLYAPTLGKADLSGLRGVRSLDAYLSPSAPAVCIRLPKDLRCWKVWHDEVEKFDLQSARHLQEVVIRPVERKKVPESFRWLDSLPELQTVRLTGAIDRDVKQLADLKSLRTIELSSYCQAMEFGDEGMTALGKLRQVESFAIVGFGSAISDAGIQVLRGFPNLRQLTLMGCPKVTAKGLAVIPDLQQLRVLELWRYFGQAGASTADTLACVKASGKLEDLSLRVGAVTDEELSGLTSLKNLRRVDLTGSYGFSDEAVLELMRELPNLEYLKFTLPRLTSGDGEGGLGVEDSDSGPELGIRG